MDLTPLHLAAKYGSLKAIRMLMASDAEMECHDSLTGATPLHMAVRYSNKDTVEVTICYFIIVTSIHQHLRNMLIEKPSKLNIQ